VIGTRILVLTAGPPRRASTRYRILAHVPALERAGYRVDVRPPVGASRGPRRLLRLLDLVRDRLVAPPAGLLLVQRKTYPPLFAAGLRRRAAAVAWDIDDALDLPPPGRDVDDEVLRRYRRNFVATADAADLVLCGNRELASRLPTTGSC
jgi:hypothetical protein